MSRSHCHYNSRWPLRVTSASTCIAVGQGKRYRVCSYAHARSSNHLDTKQIRQLELHQEELLRLIPEHERLTAMVDAFVHINDQQVPKM